jgi:phosphoribosylamine--glycine ligase
VADHKKALAGNRGPNTGGMGAVSPVPLADSRLMARIEKEIVAPTFDGLVKEGLAFRGILFFGIMACQDGPRLLSYNLRFGDPEAQTMLARFEGDFGALCAEVAAGRLPAPVFSRQIACSVVVAAPGYPIAHPRGLPVELKGQSSAMASGKPEAESSVLTAEGGPQALLFQAATGRDSNGGLRTGGGRSFTAVGLGPDWPTARKRAYDLAASVSFEGAWFRPDIGESYYGRP